ncbi:MAG: hypothetical protein ACI4OT_03365 [Bacilli bacterium]
MDKLISLINNKIEEVRNMTCSEFEIKAPIFQYSLEKFDLEKIDLNIFKKMIMLYENRNLPLEIFYGLAEFYEQSSKEEDSIEGNEKDDSCEKNNINLNLPDDFDVDLNKIKEDLKQNTLKATKSKNYYMTEINAARKVVETLRKHESNEKLIQKAKQHNNAELKSYNYYLEIRNYYNELLKINRDYEQLKKKVIRDLNRIKEFITNLPDITLIDKINYTTLQEIDENAYKEIFKQIFANQEERYNKLKEAENNLLENSYQNRYKNLLQKYNIEFEQLDIDIQNIFKNCNDIELLDNKLTILKLDSILDLTEEFLNTIINMDIKKIKQVAYLINNKIISKETVFENIDLINKDFDSLNNNASIMINHNISIDNKLYNDDILFVDNKELLNNEELLKVYRKELSEGDYIYLNDSNNFDILDLLIENDISLNSFDNYSLSQKEISNLIKRIFICTDLNIDMYTKSGNLNRSFLLGNKFYTSEETLDEYILTSNYYDENIEDFIKNNNRNHINKNINLIEEFNELEKYKSEDELSYNIDGLIISRPKVMRNLTLFLETENLNKNNILQSIIYNSNFNDSDIEIIKSTIFKNNKIKVKK